MDSVERLNRNLHIPSLLHHFEDFPTSSINDSTPLTRNSKALNEINQSFLGINLYGLSSIRRNRILSIGYRQSVALKDKDTPRLLPETRPHLFKCHSIINIVRQLVSLRESIINSLLELLHVDTFSLLFIGIKIRRKLKSGNSIVHCF